MNHKTAQITSGARMGSKAACAEFFGVSLPTVESWIRKGMPVVQRGAKGIAWAIDLCAAAEWRFAGPADSEVNPDDMAPTDRKAWYEGETKRRDLQIRDRELIPAGDVERVVSTAFAGIAAGLRAIPDLLERKYGIAGDVAEKVAEAQDLELEALADRLAVLAPMGGDE